MPSGFRSLPNNFKAAITYDYTQLIIDFGKNKPISQTKMLEITSSVQAPKQSSLEIDILDKIDVKRFSKFSDCLPDELARKAILDRDYDFRGLIRELQKNHVVFLQQEG